MTLFNEQNTQQPQTPQVDEQKDYLSELVGEGRKFSDVSALARGKAESDAFIARLQSEQADLRNELNKRDRLSELADRLEKLGKPQEQAPTRDTPDEEHKPEHAAFDPNKLNEMVNSLLNQREQKSQAERNIDTVKKTLTEKYGNSYVEKLKQQADALGVTPEWITKVAEQSPQAFFNLIGINPNTKGPDFKSPVSENRSAFEPANPNRTMAHYEKIRKTNPAEYWLPATQNQMHKDAIAQGEKFFT